MLIDMDQFSHLVIVIKCNDCFILNLPLGIRYAAGTLSKETINDETAAYRRDCGVTCDKRYAGR
jgi:hypothetical protein